MSCRGYVEQLEKEVASLKYQLNLARKDFEAAKEELTNCKSELAKQIKRNDHQYERGYLDGKNKDDFEAEDWLG